MKNKITVIVVVIMSMLSSCGETCKVCKDEEFYNPRTNKTVVLYVCRVQEC